ncbi:MAG: hypothetical protein ACYS5W_10830 [Planctomycetota bacterium]
MPLRFHDEDTSRAAFRACDGNACDRVSIFEARQCLEHMGTLDDPEGFRRLDTDKDGQLSWSEFDQHYRELCKRGGTFRMRPTRPFQPPRRPRRASPGELAAAYLLQLGDKDHDGGLDLKELQSLLLEFKMSKDFATQSLTVLDADGSGSLSQKELLLLVQNVPTLTELGRPQADRDRQSQLTGADKNGDGKVTAQELGETLRHLHPSLARWSRKVFADADADKDGVLKGAELESAAASRPAKKR